ncbi:uncharacterized protein LOC118509982 [Anopheles stephensi]|uniref:uncharacterized protein LOC118509982 n=1 Tax=Anopheles stephensi TaxID=30069 RepID=UPI001658906D|nr:uncharacterized protein LOC118509982 [Anopheles stephensi]
MKRRQEAERKRVELELQLKFVKEEEDLLAEELGIKDNPETSTLLPSHAADYMVQHSQRKEREQIQRECAHRGTPTELPVFAGDPADWPLFITFYEHTTEKCGLSNWENMLRLQKALKGPALEAVRSRLLLPEVVPQVIATLRSRYGRSTHLISALIDKVHRTPAPCLEKPETVVAFGEAVQSMVDHMKAAGRQAHLTNPLLLKEIVEKLPISEQYNWTRFVSHIEEPDLLMFREYMAELQSTAEVLSSRESPSLKQAERKKPSTRGYVHTHVETQGATPSGTNHFKVGKSCLICNNRGHEVDKCFVFGAMAVKERWMKARALSLCFGCLGKHNWRTCHNRPVCGREGCTYRHHALLHGADEERGVSNGTSASVSVRDGGNNGGAVAESNHHQHALSSSNMLFRIVPITVYGPTSTVTTFAFLDEGSSMTLVDEDLAEELGVEGEVEPLCIRWTGDTTRVEAGSRRVNFKVGPVGSAKSFAINSVRTVPKLNLPRQSFVPDEGRWKHLKRLPVREYHDAEPKVLIGLDNLRLMVPLRTIEGAAGDPIAVKTRLGWCIYGKPMKVECERLLHICECNNQAEILETMRKFYDLEQVGVVRVVELDPDVRRAQHLLETTTVRIGKRFESGLLWKADDIQLPSSIGMASRRFDCLEKRMERDGQLKLQVRRQIHDLLEKQYIHKATAQELAEADPKRIWYLPIGLVTNPNKPGKVRLIWDAAAKAQGISLNDVLLKGPDEVMSLPGVLFRFRLYAVATCADVKEMFLQIRLRKADKHAQRFLWRDDPAHELETYIVDVVTFGSTCSPATAQYVKNRNAKEHIEQFPRAVESILESTYVDDFLDSFGTVEEACQVAKEVREIFRNGGFELRNWSSNDLMVTKSLGESDGGTIKCLSSTGDDTERVLGMRWNPASDELGFCTRACTAVSGVLTAERIPTKREVLRCVMSLYDPLGLLAMFVIHGKILIQDLWRTGTQWDEEISSNQYRDWRRWVDLFQTIADIRIPRCYFTEACMKTYENSEWHLFVDASQHAYACVLYLRIVDDTGEAQCTLVGGKAKVAPLKPLTIPKLELQACVLGARFLLYTQEHHPIKAKRRVLWSDSTVALSWIRADPRNYKPFVAHRVVELLESTSANEWRWVPTDHNPADEATKWKGRSNFSYDSTWFQGPWFLQEKEDSWPKQRAVDTGTADEERRVNLHVEATDTGLLPIPYERFSKLERLQRTIGWIVRYVGNLGRKVKDEPALGGNLRHEELCKANVVLWKQTQREFFPEEILILNSENGGDGSKGKTVSKRSRIYQLLPFLDEENVLRMRGRIGAAAEVPYCARYPVILPNNCKLAELIVDRYHRVYRHANNETVVNELRQQFQIPKLRVLVMKVAKSCAFCTIRRSLPQIPPMAPLPKERLAAFVRAFTFVGLDYFGPVLVKRGRSNEKRWVALFTCLTIRAVHLEVVHSLSTESCVMAVRRFVARRGAPVEIFSDNGTNFVGASRQLQMEIQQRNDILAATFTNEHTRWTFNPPGAPHMGGVWERMVRSVKAAISTVMEVKNTPDDETFATVLYDAEAMINSRPLTYVPLDPENQEAITPNHFLLGSSSGIKQQPALPTNYRDSLRGNWKLAQHILDGVWKRWIKEYLPVITRQCKWFENVREIRSGDLVLVLEGTIRNNWNRGIVEDVIRGVDGHVRQAWVRTATGTLRRPVAKLALLDLKTQGDHT